jgi:hypothetical protein
MRGKNEYLYSMCAQSFKTRLKPTFPVMIGADENITLVLNTKWHGTSSRWQYIGIHPDHGNITQYTRLHPYRFCLITSTIDQVIHIHYCQSLLLLFMSLSLQLVYTIYFHYQQYHYNLCITSIITTCISLASSSLFSPFYFYL